jgi:drug/metabolite transporter (DMT)-like permease
MKGGAVAGIILIVLGVAAIIYQGFNFTTTKNEANVGPIHVNKTEHHSVPVPPILGAVAIAGGLFLVIKGSKA